MAQGGGSGGIRQSIELTGDDAVRAAFTRLGDSGQKAFDGIRNSAGKAATGLDDLGTSASNSIRLFASLRATANGLQSGFGALVMVAGSLKTALGGLAAFEGVKFLKDQFSGTVKGLQELRNTASSTGLAKDTIKGLQNVLSDTGLAGERVAPALVQFSGALADARKNSVALGNSLFPNINVMKGIEGNAGAAAQGIATMKGAFSDIVTPANNLVKVFKGGLENAVTDASKPFETLGVNVNNFKRDAEGTDQLIQAVANGFVKLKQSNPALAVAALAKLFGEDDVLKWGAALERIAEVGLPKFKKAAQDAGQVPGKDADDNLTKYEIAVSRVGKAWEGLRQSAVNLVLPVDTAATNAFAASLEKVSKSFRDATQAFSEGGFSALNQQQVEELKAIWGGFSTFFADSVLPAITTGWDTALKTMFSSLTGWITDATQAMQSYTDGLTSGLKTALDWAGGQISSLSKSLGTLFDNSTITGGSIPTNAGGGIIRGPGTGTSDSILSWVSDGEAITRAKAVDYYGPGFFTALNRMTIPRETLAGMFRNMRGYSMGGMVEALSAPIMPRALPRYAAGGVVATPAAADGVPIHLHFPSGVTVPLIGPRQVIQTVIRESRRSAMVSAGRKPGI